VKEVIPEFDGRRLDDIIDYQTYTSLPLLLVWRAELLPSEWAAWLLVPLLASIYGFCQTEAKTDDGFFLGFPSYWNIVALYLFLLRPPGAIALGVVLLLAVLTFVPLKYPYPSQPGRVNLWATILALPWAILLITALLGIAPDPRQWALLSLFYPALYLASALVISSRGSR
jgi:phosphatidylcholine synthase